MTNIPLPKPDNALGGNILEVITRISSVLIGLAGVIAVLFILIGGFMLIISRGSAESVQKGKNTIIYSILGLIVVILSYLIISFIINNVKT